MEPHQQSRTFSRARGQYRSYRNITQYSSIANLCNPLAALNQLGCSFCNFKRYQRRLNELLLNSGAAGCPFFARLAWQLITRREPAVSLNIFLKKLLETQPKILTPPQYLPNFLPYTSFP